MSDTKDYRRVLEGFIKQCSYMKDTKVDFEAKLNYIGIDEIGMIALTILLEKEYKIDMVKYMSIDNKLSYTANDLIKILCQCKSDF